MKTEHDLAKDFTALSQVLIGAMLSEPSKWVPLVHNAIRNVIVWPNYYRGAVRAIYDLQMDGQVFPESIALRCDISAEELATLQAGVALGEYHDDTINYYVSSLVELGKRFAKADIAKRLLANEVSSQEAANELLDLDSVNAVMRSTTSQATGDQLDEMVASMAVPGALTGIDTFDSLVCGCGPRESTSFAAIYGGRKTSVLRNMALSMAARGSKIIILLAEGTRILYTAFCVSMIANALIMAEGRWDDPQNKYPLNGYVITRTDHWKRRPLQKIAFDRAVKIWKSLGVEVLDSDDGADDAESIRSEAIRRRRDDGVQVVCMIDYIQEVKVYERTGKHRRQITQPFQAAVAHKGLLHEMMKTDAHVMIAAQKPESAFNEDAKKSPSAQIKGGGEIPQIVDVAMDVVYTKDEPTALSLVTKKNRKGPFGNLYFEVEKESGLIISEKRITADGEVIKPVHIIPEEMLIEPKADQQEMILS